MTKQMTCWKCGGQLSVTADVVGLQVKCPHCSTAVPVPGELFDAPVAAPIRIQPPRLTGGPLDQSQGILTASIVLSGIALFLELLGAFVEDAPVLDILGMVVGLGATATWLVFHYQLWSMIPKEHAETTPWRAVGFLFIPFYNFAWIFTSCVGLQRSLNAYASSRNLQRVAAPGLATVYSILFIVALPLGLLAGMASESEVGPAMAMLSFLLGGLPSFVFWLLMVLNQKQAAATLGLPQRILEPSQA
jgi:hypothetical protein